MEFPDLAGSRIDLVALDHAAIDDIHMYSVMPEFYRYFEFLPFTAREQTEDYFAKLRRRSNGETGYYWMIRLRETGRVIGTFGVLEIDRRKGSAEIGYGVSSAHWGKGLFTEALRLFLDWAFGAGQFHRIWAKTQADNLPSIGALMKSGFRREGTMRDFYLSQQDGRRHDATLLSILRSDRAEPTVQTREGRRSMSDNSRLGEMVARYPALAGLRESILDAFELLRGSVAAGGRLLICGNGGSAADSEHIVGELLKGFRSARPLNETERRTLVAAHGAVEGTSLADRLQRAIPAISLVSQVALMTAVANDTDANFIFAQQVFGLGRSGDVLFAISTSGNSVNVVTAAKVARALGIRVLALTGADGGILKTYADVAIRVPTREVAAVQEIHLPVYHCLCSMLEDAFFVTGAASLPEGPDGLSPAVSRSAPSAAAFPESIGLVVFDFDGVFTNNKVYTDQNGVESVICDRRDGLGLDELRAKGVPVLILSTEKNPVVAARARKLKLDVAQACSDKAAYLSALFAERALDPSQVVYVGNDVNDLAAMKMVGFPVAPADAHPAVRAAAALVLNARGGEGAVRELCDLIVR